METQRACRPLLFGLRLAAIGVFVETFLLFNRFWYFICENNLLILHGKPRGGRRMWGERPVTGHPINSFALLLH